MKLSSVASDILGKSGRDMLDALVTGTRDPDVLAELARGRLRAKIPMLGQALTGRFGPTHALVVGEILAHIDYLEEAIGRVSARSSRIGGGGTKLGRTSPCSISCVIQAASATSSPNKKTILKWRRVRDGSGRWDGSCSRGRQRR